MSEEHKPLGQTDWIPIKNPLSKILLLPFCFLLHSSFIFGQTIKEFKEIWVNESREYLLNNQKPLPYLQSGFHQFSRVQDDAFTDVLEQNWEKFSVVPGTPIPKSKKFDPAPQFVFDETSYHNPQFLPYFTAEKNEDVYEKTFANLPRIRKPEYISLSPLKLSFKFYGNNIAITYDKLLTLPVNHPICNEVVVDYWKKFLIANSNHLVSQLMTYRDRLGLNDWGFFLLVKDCSNALYPSDETGAVLLSWALMIRSGYDVKIGYNQLGASVLYTTTPEINGNPSVRINGSTYYIDKSISSFPLLSYIPNHPGATGTIHLKFNQSLNFQGEIQPRKIQFQWDKKWYEFNLKYNPEVIRFLEEYPQTDPDIFFSAPFTFLAGETLLKQFKPILAGMKKVEGAAFLQQFVQKSFAYRPYNDLYGYDRFMFPEELLFKDESNDKGKALLYSWMINNLLNQNAALVEFPGFYSVAISLDQPMDGDNFLLEGKSYTIADPTFGDAPIGLIMKEFYPIKPLILPLKNVSEEADQQEKIWKLALALGAERSGSRKDFLKDENGNSYIAGFYKEKIANKLIAVPAPFIAKFDENNSLTWMEKFHSNGRAFGLELKQLDKNEFYLAGSFRGELEYNGIKIQTDPSAPDLFFALFNRQGKIEWISKSGLDDLEEDTKLFYVVRFTRSGDIQSVQLANEDERTGATGFQQCTFEGLCYVASRYQTTGLEKASEEATQKSAILVRQNLNRMKQLGIEQSIASLASVLNSMLSPGNQLSGSELALLKQEKVTQRNSSTPKMAEIIQKLKLLKNNDGIVEIFTADSNPIKILSFRIFNHSHFKITPLENNDLIIKVIDGIEFDSGSLREKVNSLVLDLSTNNIVLDLGRDHLITSINLKHEILK